MMYFEKNLEKRATLIYNIGSTDVCIIEFRISIGLLCLLSNYLTFLQPRSNHYVIVNAYQYSTDNTVIVILHL